jgi:DNA-binding NarL/FixJ family response regulator
VTKILLADDHPLFREGLERLFATVSDVAVVGTAGNGPQTLELAKERRPDQVLLDISMPGMSGAEVARELIRVAPSVKIILLTMHKEARYTRLALRPEISAYLVKTCAFEEVLEAIRTVDRGGRFLSRALRRRTQGARDPSLTSRESEILRLVSAGLTSREIGDHLCISLKTVEAHRGNILEKLDARNMPEALNLAWELGMV